MKYLFDVLIKAITATPFIAIGSYATFQNMKIDFLMPRLLGGGGNYDEEDNEYKNL